MDTTRDLYDQHQRRLIDEFDKIDIASDDFASATKNLSAFSQVRALMPEPEPAPAPVPVTKWERLKCGVSAVWDNETTRVLIKAGGAFAGVGLVVWSTIHKETVVERTALAQANQRNS